MLKAGFEFGKEIAVAQNDTKGIIPFPSLQPVLQVIVIL